MEPKTPLLDSKQLKEEMDESQIISNKEILENILKKGIDVEYLKTLRTFNIKSEVLEELRKKEPFERINGLEVLVQRLLIRVARLEIENEKRFLELIKIMLELNNISEFLPKMQEVYNHFFKDFFKDEQPK